MAMVNPSFLGVGILLILAAVVMLIVYIEKFLPLNKSIKLIENKGLDWHTFISDIDTATFLPKSKIYCGKTAFVPNSTLSIIPYSSVLWIYQHVTKAYGVVTMTKEVIILTDSGTQFNLAMNIDELKWLLENKYSEFPSSLMVGYTEENRKSYFNLIKK